VIRLGRHLLALLALAAVVATPAAAVSAEDTFSTRVAGQATGVHVKIVYESRDASGRPRALRKHVFSFPPGTVFDAAGAGVCQASAAELRAQGLDACPEDSKVGSGSLRAYATRPPGSALGTFDTDVTIFNAAHPKDAPGVPHAFIAAISIGGQVQAANVVRVDGNVLTEEPAHVCSNPAEPPPCPSGEFTVQSVDYTVHQHSRTVGGRRHTLIATPPGCPAAGRWDFGHLMEYRDDASASAASSTPCIPMATERIRLTATPRTAKRCRATRFTFTAVTSRGPVAGATVRFANRRALTDGHGRAALPARMCVPGLRRALVVADGFRKGAARVRVAR
jgi:hypothetical protein